jgi:hypothetical protein
VLESTPIPISEIVQMKDDPNTSGARPAHQFQADRVPAIGEQHLWSEPAEYLVDQVEKDYTLTWIGRSLGAARASWHQGHTHVAHF